ncbi:MAG: ATP-binding protein [Cyanobacteria bacterium Co-bin13]|nr:ATP-binding protein [Cyanobacteria bacterium Co-bin13]
MVNSPFLPQQLIGREAELHQLCQLLDQDSDFLVVGVSGIGRRTLIQAAAHAVRAKIMTIDCLRCRSGSQFLRLLADSLTETFGTPAELALMQRWSTEYPLSLDQVSSPPRLTWPEGHGHEWSRFEALLALPQHLAEALNCQVVIVFHNLSHIRSWDRKGRWETYLRQKIQAHSRVSYALIATMAEPWVYDSGLPVIHLNPLADTDLKSWVTTTMATEGLKFDPDSQALKLFLSYVQGHFGDAIALAQRLWLEHQVFVARDSPGLIQAHHVQRSMLGLVQDMAVTFEALILLLPPTQARLLEILALDPTDSPQSQAYIKKHQLSRGGGLQGALNSLEQKGLIYGPNLSYRIALPLLNFWLKQRLN